MIYYHIYNRGAHKAPIFHDRSDYWRMLKLFFIANSPKPFNLSRFGETNIFSTIRQETLVNILAYCLMPNHIHIAICSKTDMYPEPGITKFMLKLCTAYSCYYNNKYSHSGTIWQGTYNKKIADDQLSYIRTLITYIHLNPYGIKEPEMTKDARKEHHNEAWEYSLGYEYSSLKDFIREGNPRQQFPILDPIEFEKWNNFR
mgnify:CR=1 FL=1